MTLPEKIKHWRELAEKSTRKPVPAGHCELCGEMMPRGQEMFKYHGFNGNCPKPPLEQIAPSDKTLADAFRTAVPELLNEVERLQSCDRGRFVCDAEIARLETKLAEATRKGEELCVQLGNAMMRLREAKEVLEFYASPEPQTEVWDKSLLIDRGDKASTLLGKWGKG